MRTNILRKVISRTSALKSSSGYPSTALMLNFEPGCTTAKPPDTSITSVELLLGTVVWRTEVLFASSCLFDDLDKTRLQLLNRWDVVGKDTHFSGLCWEVDLDAACRHLSALSLHWFLDLDIHIL